MTAFVYYCLKVIACSGIFYIYYLLGLKNKAYHQWNRFYLIFSVILSLVLPVIDVSISKPETVEASKAIELLQVIQVDDAHLPERDERDLPKATPGNYPLMIYVIISSVLFIFFINSLLRIYRIKKKHASIVVDGVTFINTSVRGTPFSFFTYIFWNEEIDVNSETGKKIYRHELAHVTQKHSYDKIAINLILIVLWINPFFWIVKKELSMLHEFLADKEAVEQNDIETFAQMILLVNFPANEFSITNNFFSPIKRRLKMLRLNSKTNYLSRILILPLVALTFAGFTFRIKNTVASRDYKPLIVVIDAGHGGSDGGATVNNLFEKNVTLSLAKKIKELNKNPKLTILLSREEDSTISPMQRVQFATLNKANIFISLHIATEPLLKSASGLFIHIPKNESPFLMQSKLLASSLIAAFKSNYKLPTTAQMHQSTGNVAVLKSNECPSVIINPGYFSNQKDVDFLLQEEAKITIASNILKAIDNYADSESEK